MSAYAKNISVINLKLQRKIALMHRIIGTIVIAVLLSLNLSGCSVIACLFNGEGYCGVRGGDGPTAAPASDPGNVPLKVPTYFWNEQNYTCLNSDELPISSHKGVIKLVSSSTFEAYRDKCSSDRPYKGDVSELEVLGSVIGFGDGLYEKKDENVQR